MGLKWLFLDGFATPDWEARRGAAVRKSLFSKGLGELRWCSWQGGEMALGGIFVLRGNKGERVCSLRAHVVRGQGTLP